MSNLEWKTVHEVPGADDVLVRVQRRGDFKPLYSIQLGKRRKDDPERLMVFVPVKTEGQGRLTLNRDVERMLKEALDWVEADANQYEDIRVQKMIQRESSRSSREDQGLDRHVGHNGKTQRKRERSRGGSNGVARGVSYDDSEG